MSQWRLFVVWACVLLTFVAMSVNCNLQHDDVTRNLQTILRADVNITDSLGQVTSHSRSKRSVERDNTDLLQVRSLCSWSYAVDHDDNRIPVDIQKAVDCVNRVEGQTTNVCYMVQFWVPVRYRQQTTAGVVTWTDSWVKLPVGCTLANPIRNTPPPTTIPPTAFPIV